MDISFIIRLVDQFTKPAEGVKRTLGGIAEAIEDTEAKLGVRLQEAFSADNMDQWVQSAEQGFGKARSRLIGAGAQAIALFAPVKAAADFETAMNRVAAVSGATGAEFDALRAQAMELGRTTQFTASQAADAQGFLAMAGFDADSILGAMPGTLQLAASAQMDLGRAADIVSNILTGYSKDVSELGHVNDVLVKSFTSSNTDLTMLGEAMKYAGPVAAGAGVQFEEAAAAISLMGNAGIQGSMAGTSLRGGITRILSPSKEVRTLMRELGLEFTDTAGRLLPLVEIIGQLEPLADDAGLFMDLFGQRAGPAMLAIASQGAAALGELTGELEASGGTAERIGQIQMQGMNGMLLEMKSAAEGAAIAIGTMLIPQMSQLASQVTPAINALTDFTAANPELTSAVLSTVAALMGLSIGARVIQFLFAGLRLGTAQLAGTFLRFDTSGRNVAIGWRVLAGAGTVLSGALALVGTVAGTALAAIGALGAPAWAAAALLGAAAFALWKYWDRISAFVGGFAAGIGEGLQPAVDAAGDAIAGLLDNLGALFGVNPEDMELFREGFQQALARAFDVGPLVDGAREALEGFWGWLGSFFAQEQLSDEETGAMYETGRRMGEDLINGITAFVSTGIEGIKNLFSFEIGWQMPDWGGWFGGGQPAALAGQQPSDGGVLEAITGLFTGGGDPLRQEVEASIAAEVFDKRPPNVTINAPITVNGQAAPQQAANHIASEIAKAREGAVHGGVD